MGTSVTISSIALPAPHLRENTGIVAATKTCSRDFSPNSKRTVRLSSATTRAMPVTAVCTKGAAPLLDSILWLCTTSSAVTGSPLLKRASRRIRKLTPAKPGATCMASASRP